jgi:hypothetical protein
LLCRSNMSSILGGSGRWVSPNADLEVCVRLEYWSVDGGWNLGWRVCCPWHWILLADAANRIQEFRNSRLQAPVRNGCNLPRKAFCPPNSLSRAARGRCRTTSRDRICSGYTGSSGKARPRGPAAPEKARTNNISAAGTSYFITAGAFRTKHLGFGLRVSFSLVSLRFVGLTPMVRVDHRHLAKEAARRERRSWTYLIITSVIILLVAFGFIWLTW